MKQAPQRRPEWRRWSGLGTVCLLLAFETSLLAQTPQAPEETKYAIAVTGVKASGGTDPTIISGLDQLVAVEAGQSDRVSVISSSDIQAMLGLEAQKQLLACGDSGSCLAELGGALGVGHLLTTEISKVGKNWLLYVTLIDVETAKVVSREARRPSSEDDLVDQTIEGVRAVMGKLLGLEGGAATAATETGPAGRKVAKQGKPLNLRPWIRWGGSALGVGLALTGGLVLYAPAASARSNQNDWLENKAGVSAPPYTVDEARAYESQADLGLVLMISGAALVATGWVVPQLLGSESKTRAAVVLGPGQAAVVVGGRF